MNRRPRIGFTLIELLVTIGIITVLLAILVPVVAHVRLTAMNSASQAQVKKISDALSVYRQDFGAYPGILPDRYFPGDAAGLSPFQDTRYRNMTQTEDMVLALLGGINMTSFPSGKLVVQTGTFGQPDYFGTGPMNLNPVNPKAMGKPYIDRRAEELPPQLDRELYRQDSMPQFSYIGNSPYPDTPAPEFLDQFSSEDRRPILYMRANPGGKGSNILSATYNKDYHYNFSTIQLYLSTRDPMVNITDARTYLTGPSGNTAKYAGSYILISAGMDHVFGSPDDIIFGGGGGQ